METPDQNEEEQIINVQLPANISDLTDKDLEFLATELARTNFDAPENKMQQTRMKLKEWLEKTGLAKTDRPSFEWLHSGRTFNSNKEFLKNFLLQKIRDGSTEIMRVNNEVAGIGHTRTAGKMDDGRTVYEIGGLVLKPEFRNRGLSKMLMKDLINEIESRHPSSPIMVQTKNPKLINYYSKLGWREIGIREKAKFIENEHNFKIPEPRLQEDEAHNKKSGWKIFLFDPKGNKMETEPKKE